MKKIDYFKIPDIIIKKIYQQASQSEISLLNHWLDESKENQELFKRIGERKDFSKRRNKYSSIKDDIAWQKINTRLSQQPFPKIIPLYYKILRYAAVLLAPFIIASVVYYIYEETREYTLAEMVQESNPLDLQEATLVLEDGSRLLNLMDVNADTLQKLTGAKILPGNNSIRYDQKIVRNNSLFPKLNTLIVPKARVHNIVLSDGTKVTINAASSLQYPVFFNDESRLVKLTGEAYFNVAKDKNKPFIITTNGMNIEVLGTEFNVSSYGTDNEIVTTLIEGSVKVKVGTTEMTLQPGEQAILFKKKDTIAKKMVNTELFTSWKDGRYIFEYENLESVMKKIGRWYNVEIFYDDEQAKQYHFKGTLNKYDEIKNTLYIIELATNLEFEITKTTVLIKQKNRKKIQ